MTPPESALAQDSPSWVYNARWQRTWSNRMFTEFNVGNFGYDWPMAPNVDYKTNPPHHDNGTGVDKGAGWLNAGLQPNSGPGDIARDKPQVFANMTYYLPTSKGSHDLKVGFECIKDKSLSVGNGASGPILYLDQNGAPNTVRITDFGDPAAFGKDWTQSADYDRRYAAVRPGQVQLRSDHADGRPAVRPPAAVLRERDPQAADHVGLVADDGAGRHDADAQHLSPRVGLAGIRPTTASRW